MPIVLNATNMSLIGKLAGAPATTNPDFVFSWTDESATSYTPGTTYGSLNGTTEVTLAGAPSTDIQRIIKSGFVSNIDTASVTFSLLLAIGAVRKYIIPPTVVASNQVLRFGESLEIEIGTDINVTVEGGGITGQFSTIQAGENLGGNRAVIIDDDGLAYYADQSNADHLFRVVGITTGAISIGATGSAQTVGELTEPTWAWTPGGPIFLSTTGLLTQTAPVTGFHLVIAEARTATKINIEKQMPIVMAA